MQTAAKAYVENVNLNSKYVTTLENMRVTSGSLWEVVRTIRCTVRLVGVRDFWVSEYAGAEGG